MTHKPYIRIVSQELSLIVRVCVDTGFGAESRKFVTWSILALIISLESIAGSAAGDFAFELIADDFDNPIYVTQAPGDDNTLYVAQQFGSVMAMDLATGDRREFLRIDGNLPPSAGMGGIHGFAFHPDFSTNGRVYLSWIDTPDAGPGVSRLDEYIVPKGQISAQHSRVLYREPTFGATDHLINWIGFDPTARGRSQDYLYVMVGDNRLLPGTEEFVNVAQDLSTPYGKVLRIDVDPTAADYYPENSNRDFGIPSDNPFVDDDDDATLGEVLHSGLRNPWRASFDRATGDLYIGNVGEGVYEEIEFARAGEAGIDFGWPSREGTQETTFPRGLGGPRGDSRNPVYEYIHQGSSSVIGGYVYRGPIQSLRGSYFFADFSRQRIWKGDFDRETEPATFDGQGLENIEDLTALFSAASRDRGGTAAIVSFGEDNAGNIYVVDRIQDGSEIFRIVDALSGDFNGNGTVEQRDLDLVLGSWGVQGPHLHGAWVVNRPTRGVHQAELSQVLLNWGNTYASARAAAASGPVPEPTAVALLLACGLLVPKLMIRTRPTP